MEKTTIFKLGVSAVLLILAVVFASGLIGGKPVSYQNPGPYTAERTNQFSTVKVDAIIDGGRITDCEITSSGESDLMTDAIREEWASAIVEGQSADVDAITSASLVYSAGSVKEAVDDILVQAGLKEPSEAPAEAPIEEPTEEPVEEPAEEPTEAPAEAGAYADGTYSAERTNDFSTVKVDATIEGGKIADCAITSSGDNDLMTDAIREEWASAIVEAQSADADAITSSSLVFSAGSVKEAVDDILAQASGSGAAAPADDARIAELEARIAELETAASEAESRADEAEARVAELEAAATGVAANAMQYMRPRPAIEAAEEAPAEEAATNEATGDADKYMRPRPVIEAAEEAPAEATAEATGDAEKYMRPRPAIEAASTEEAPAEEATNEATGDADQYMRPRPAIEAASTEEAPAEATAEATGDAEKYMRPRPAIEAASTEEAPAEEATNEATDDADKYMRPRPAAEAAAEEAPAEATAEATGDADQYMRPRPAIEAASTEEATAEATAEATGDADQYMRPRPATEAAAEEAAAGEAEVSDTADLSAALPAIVVSMGANKENSYVTDYLEQDPYLVNLYEGYGFAKDYGSARGHEYTLEDVAKTQRPHPKANCLTCKTPDFHKLVEQEGVGVYSMPFDDVMAQMTTNVNCYTCHGDDTGNGGAMVVTHQYVNEALGENVSAIHPATLSCGQCHIEYYFTPADSETMMPYDSVEAMTPEAILAYYDEMDFADWTQESTGTRLLKAQHPEMETFLAGKHANFLSCADCHMPTETTDSGVAYHSHKLVSPLESESLLESCATCHRDTDMVAFVHDIQEKVTGRESEVGNKLSAMKDKLAEAAQSGAWSEEDLDAVRKLHRQAQWYFDFCYVENSEGAHNSALSMRCLDTSDALIDEALALLDK